MPIDKVEALQLLKLTFNKVVDAVSDDGKISFAEWTEIVKAVGAEAFEAFKS